MAASTGAQASLSERVAGAIFWNTLAFPVKAAIKFLAGLVLLWALSQEEYGYFQAVNGSLVAAIWTYTGLGISAAILKFVPEVMERQGRPGVGRFLRGLFTLRLGLLLAVVLALNVFSAAVIDFFKLGELGPLLLRAGSAVVIIRAVTDTCGRVLTAYFQQKTTNALDIISSLVQPLLLVALVPGARGGWGVGLGIRGAVIALLVGSIVDLALALYAVRRALGRLPRVEIAPRPVQRLWRRFGATAAMNYVMDLSINITSPDFVALLLLWAARPRALADLEAGWNQVMILLTYLIMPLSGIYVPMFSEIFAKGDDHKLQPAYATLTRALLLATVPAGIGFSMIAPQVFTLLGLSIKYPHAAAAAQILTLFMFAESIVVVPHVILMVYERFRVVLASRLLAVLSAPLIAYVAVRSSPATVALVIGAARLGSRAILTPYAGRRFGLRFPRAFALRLLLPSLAFALVLALIRPALPVLATQPVWRNLLYLGVQIALAVVVFVVGFKALGGLDPEDRKRLTTLRIPFRNLILRHL
jgi:O-antigen/teichoic acid export membrane protein